MAQSRAAGGAFGVSLRLTWGLSVANLGFIRRKVHPFWRKTSCFMRAQVVFTGGEDSLFGNKTTCFVPKDDV